MSIIGDALYTKLSYQEIRNKVYYSDYVYDKKLHFDGDDYSYMDLYNKVSDFMKIIREKYKDERTCFLVIENSIDDIAFFIALMELNIKPIIIHKDKLIELYLSNIDVKYMELNPNLDNIIMPFKRDYYFTGEPDYEKEASFISNLNTRSSCYLSNVEKEIRLDRQMINRILNYYLRKNDLVDSLEQDDYDFGILTSGTTSNFKIQKVKEKDLYNKIKNDYDLAADETIINTTPISSISGLIFNLYIPLLSASYKHICVSYNHLNPMIKSNGRLSVVLPGGKNLFPNFNTIGWSMLEPALDNIKFNHIYYMGKKIKEENINNIFACIDNLPNDCIYNYYGNTENLGLICKCNQEHLKPIYLYGLDIRNNSIIYSPNQKDVYAKKYIDGQLRNLMSLIQFNKDLFIPIFPISDNYENDSKIINTDDNLFGELLVNDEQTGDYGFAHDGLLYLVGRNNEFIQKDNKYILLSSFENAIKEKTGSECVIARTENTTNLYLISRSGKIRDKYKDYYKTDFDRLHAIKSFIDKHNILIDNYVIIDEKDLPTGIEIGKIKKDFLLQYSFPKLDQNSFNKPFEENVLKIFNAQISSLFGRIVNVEKYDGSYLFDKNHFSFPDIISIASNYCVYRIEETDDFYQLYITNSFITAKHPNNINPKKSVYQTIRELFNDPNEKITIQILLSEYSTGGIEFFIDKLDENNFYIEHTKYTLETIERTRDNISYNLEDYILLPENREKRKKAKVKFLYFDAYMKDGKIYLEDCYSTKSQGDIKVYKIKK